MNHHSIIYPYSFLVRLACGGLLILVMSMSVLHAQDADSTRPEIEIYAQIGYHAMDLSSMKGMLDGLGSLLFYTYNIRAQKLLRFPGNAIAGGSVAWRVSEATRIELGANYTRSRGHLAYKDMYGSIDEDLRINVAFIHAGAQHDLFQISDVTTYLSVRVGGLISWMYISEQIVFNEFPEYNSSASDDGTAYFIAGELDAGIRANLFGWNIALEGGYRTNLENYQYDFNDSFDGWLIATRVQIPLGD
jgi:hypothetical protein